MGLLTTGSGGGGRGDGRGGDFLIVIGGPSNLTRKSAVS